MNRIIIVTLAIALSMVGCKTSKIAKKNASAYQPAIEKSKMVETDKTKVETVEIAEVAEKTEIEAPIIVRTESLSVASGEDQTQGKFAYYVIIGSFASNDNAKKLKEGMISKGFTPVIMLNENDMFRVSIMQTNSETEARGMIGEIRSTFEEHKDVWLLKRK